MSKSSKAIFTTDQSDSSFDFYSKRAILKIDSKNFPQEFYPIVALFVEDCNYNIKELRSDMGRLFIVGQNSAGDKRNELMLRYGDKQLIVARVAFIHQRKGNMTRLYAILKQIRKKYKLDPIIIEQCVTAASKSWCEKNGFVKEKNGGMSYIEREK